MNSEQRAHALATVNRIDSLSRTVEGDGGHATYRQMQDVNVELCNIAHAEFAWVLRECEIDPAAPGTDVAMVYAMFLGTLEGATRAWVERLSESADALKSGALRVDPALTRAGVVTIHTVEALGNLRGSFIDTGSTN